MKRRHLLGATVAGLLSPALVIGSAGPASAAPIVTDPALVAAARKEGSVVWYVSLVEAQIARPMAAAFEAKYPGIKVRLVAGTVGDLLSKLLAETRAGTIQADVSHGGSAVWPLMRAGAIEPYVPAQSAAYPADLKDPNGIWTAQLLSLLVPAINTDLVAAKDIPGSFQDLLDPRWKGKIAWTTQMTQGGPPGFIGTVLKDRGEQAGMAFLRAFAAQKPINLPASQRAVLDQVISGEYPAALCTFNYHSEISRADGAPIQALPLDPVTETLDVIFLTKGPHREAGKLFVEYVLSEEGQRVFRAADYLPAHPAVDAKIATLKPEAGHFRTVLLPPDLVEQELQHWIGIYDTLFR